MTLKDLSFSKLALAAVFSSVFLAGCINDDTSSASKSDGISRTGDKPAAQVGSSLIYESDVLRAAKAQKRLKDGDVLNQEDDVYQALLDELIDQRLLKLAALDEGIAEAPEVKRRLAEARERILATYYVERHLTEAVNEDSLMEMYKGQALLRQNGGEAKLRMIRAESEAEIRAIEAKLIAGEKFGELARTLSTDSASKTNSGDMGYVSRAMLPDELGAVVFTTKAGTRSKPFETKDGWHIIAVSDFRLPAQASFEAMRPQLRQYKTYAEIQNLMTRLRNESRVERLSDKAASEGPNE